MIYFDNAATTKPHQTILDIYNKATNECWYNESSAHKLGITSQRLLTKATNLICETLKLRNKKLIFTGSASEANNLAIYGICNKYIGTNKHIITTKIEHPSVLNCFKDLENKGFSVTYLDVDMNGQVNLKQLQNALTKDTILLSIMWVNNIVGSIQPLAKIKEIIAKYPRIKFHSDIVQGIGKVDDDFNLNDLDMCSLTAHKINGLKGTGLLIINDNMTIDPLVKGGHQQNNMRAGTVDVPGAVQLAKTLQITFEKRHQNYQHVKELNQKLTSELLNIPNVMINKPQDNYSPYILNFSLTNLKGETLMHYLEKDEIYLGFGSACNASSKALEKTLMEMYHDEMRAANAVRVSFSSSNTIQEVEILINKLKEVGKK